MEATLGSRLQKERQACGSDRQCSAIRGLVQILASDADSSRPVPVWMQLAPQSPRHAHAQHNELLPAQVADATPLQVGPSAATGPKAHAACFLAARRPAQVLGASDIGGGLAPHASSSCLMPGRHRSKTRMTRCIRSRLPATGHTRVCNPNRDPDFLLAHSAAGLLAFLSTVDNVVEPWSTRQLRRHSRRRRGSRRRRCSVCP